MKWACACALFIVIGTAGVGAAQTVYEGDEAAALRCANMIALTGIALGGAGLISPQEREVMVGLAGLILDRHVGGTRTQKLLALEIMQSRRGPEATLLDYQDNVRHCLARFPIN